MVFRRSTAKSGEKQKAINKLLQKAEVGFWLSFFEMLKLMIKEYELFKKNLILT